MDLSEVRAGVAGRHPWESSRAASVVRILAKSGRRFDSALDYGCGDGFLGNTVQETFRVPVLVGVDVHLTAAACGSRRVPEGTSELFQSNEDLGTRRFDLILLCDVIEHVEDDRALLLDLVNHRLSGHGLMLVTVPAYQALFSEHDRALRHHRRYDLARLKAVISSSGLEVVSDGYLFFSLLAPRLLEKGLELVWRRPAAPDHGVGHWRGGALVTTILSNCLAAENALLIAARQARLLIPGLTAWALCKTP